MQIILNIIELFIVFLFLKVNALFFNKKKNHFLITFLKKMNDFINKNYLDIMIKELIEMSDKLLDIIWSLDIKTINNHLPAEQKTLKQLLSEEKPQIFTKEKRIHKINKRDLETISLLLPENEWSNIKLPIVLLRRTDLDKGLFSVSGGKQELYVIFRTIGKTEENFAQFKEKDVQLYIWKPEAFALVKKIGSLVVIGFV